MAKNTNKNLEIKIFNKNLNFFHPIHKLYRNHEKLLSVDGGTDFPLMILGGRNNTEEYFGKSKELNFLDLDILIAENSAVKAHDYFLNLWYKNPELSNTNYSTKELKIKSNKTYYDFININELNYLKYSIFKIYENLEEVGPIFFTFNDPTLKMNHIKNKIVHRLINGVLNYTKESLTILTPYLYPTNEEYSMLKKLAAKNIKIKIITNSLRSNDLKMGQKLCKNS